MGRSNLQSKHGRRNATQSTPSLSHKAEEYRSDRQSQMEGFTVSGCGEKTMVKFIGRTSDGTIGGLAREVYLG